MGSVLSLLYHNKSRRSLYGFLYGNFANIFISFGSKIKLSRDKATINQDLYNFNNAPRLYRDPLLTGH